jgi:Fe-S-cluster containining protein
MSDKPAILRKLEAIYASLPTIECKKLCGFTNCGGVPFEKIERRNLADSGFERRRDPYVRIGELTCTYLSKEGTCEIYAARPLICRLFGLVDVKILRCPHGCVPSRWLTDLEAKQIMKAVFDLGM